MNTPKVRQQLRRIRLFAAVAFLAVITCGCSSTGGLTLFPQKNKLHDVADDGRRAVLCQGPLPIARELDKSTTPLYVIEPGDGLLIQASDVHSTIVLPPDQTVLPDGTVHLGKYGLVHAAGKTIPELQAIVRAQIHEFHNKDMGPITARVVAPESKHYYVLGEVNAPGSFALKGNESVLDGILAAGGLGPRASRSAIILSRPTAPHCKRIVLPVCYDAIVQLGDTTTNYQLRPGDRIYVAGRSCFEELFGHHFRNICRKAPQIPCDHPSEACQVHAPRWTPGEMGVEGPLPTGEERLHPPRPVTTEAVTKGR